MLLARSDCASMRALKFPGGERPPPPPPLMFAMPCLFNPIFSMTKYDNRLNSVDKYNQASFFAIVSLPLQAP